MFIELTLVGSPNEEFGRRLYLRPKYIQGFHEGPMGGAIVFFAVQYGLELQVRENVDEIRERIYHTERAEKGETLGEFLAVASAALQTQLATAQGDELEALPAARAEEGR